MLLKLIEKKTSLTFYISKTKLDFLFLELDQFQVVIVLKLNLYFV